MLPSTSPTLTEQGISEHISFKIPGRVHQDSSIVLCDSTLEDSVVLQRRPGVFSDIDNFVSSTGHFYNFIVGPRETDVEQRVHEIYFAGSEVLEGMKLDNIKPQKASSSSLWPKV